MGVCFVLLTRARVSLGVNDARIMMRACTAFGVEGRCTSSAAPRHTHVPGVRPSSRLRARQHGIHAHGKLRDRPSALPPPGSRQSNFCRLSILPTVDC